MSDYLEALRHEANCLGTDTHESKLLHEAADRIEELQAQVNDMERMDYPCQKCEALQECLELAITVTTADHIAELEEKLEAHQWQPIETYDALKKKPKFAVFYVPATEPTRHGNYQLSELVSTTRCFGNRDVTYWQPLGEPPREEP
jgi:hypothetical protein